MKNVLTKVFNVVFSGSTLFVLGAAALGFILIATVDKQQTQESICYAQGMVRVKTDAGARCVLPNSLVEIK
jgi:hypothetical protein